MRNGGHKHDNNLVETDVLIVGAGAAGLRAAIELAREGVDVLVLGKRRHGDAHTVWAAGGINASLATWIPTTGGRYTPPTPSGRDISSTTPGLSRSWPARRRNASSSFATGAVRSP